MAVKLLILIALGMVVWQLFSALRAMTRGGQGDPQRLLQALKMRVIFSMLIVAVLFVLGAAGLLDPHGL